MLYASPQWFVVRNVTSKAKIFHNCVNNLQLDPPTFNCSPNLIDREFNCYISFSTFNVSQFNPAGTVPMSLFHTFISTPVQNRTWSELKHIIDKFHRHVSYFIIWTCLSEWQKKLLLRNKTWNGAIEQYVMNTLDSCAHRRWPSNISSEGISKFN